MACFHSLSAAISIIFMSLALPSQGLNLKSAPPIIAAAPAVLPNPPLPSPSARVLPPDIAPLFPTPGSGSSMPTIPSTRSPPNPDATSSVGPDAAVAPSGLLQDSSADHGLQHGIFFHGCLAYLLLVMLYIM